MNDTLIGKKVLDKDGHLGIVTKVNSDNVVIQYLSDVGGYGVYKEENLCVQQ